VLHLLPATAKLHEFGAEKPISLAKPAHFDFFTINFTIWSHILSTGGDAPQMLGEFLCSCYNMLVPGFLETKEPLIPRF
jgi:hypothetical protein